ncbi:hypothetical protein CR513_07440, partial [Mucuna pruriens]
MEATHILLGRPWQFDRKVTHDGVTNKFSFVHKGNKRINLKGKKKIEEEKKEKIKSEKSKVKKDKKNKNGSLLVSRKSIKKVLLNKKEPLLLLPTNMCLVLNSPLKNLPTTFERMLEEFKDIFPKEMYEGLPSIKGIKH